MRPRSLGLLTQISRGMFLTNVTKHTLAKSISFVVGVATAVVLTTWPGRGGYNAELATVEVTGATTVGRGGKELLVVVVDTKG